MSWWVPSSLVRVLRLGNGKEGLLVNSRVSGLIKGEDVDVVVLVFLDDSCSVLVGVERVHEDEWDIDIVLGVEVLTNQSRILRCTVLYLELTSICLTLRSKKVIPSLTSMILLGPTHPMVVPRPPLSFKTASLLRIAGSTEGRTWYGRTCSGLGALIFSQSL